jgi:hypothetical protein
MSYGTRASGSRPASLSDARRSTEGSATSKDRAVTVAIIGAIASVLSAGIAFAAGHEGIASGILPGGSNRQGAAAPAPSVTVSAFTNRSNAPTDPTTETSAAPEVFHAGTVMIGIGGHVDLDAPPADGTWGFLRDDGDLTWSRISSDQTLILVSGLKHAVVHSSNPMECASSQVRWNVDDIPGSAIRNGYTSCIQTSGGRTSLFTMTSVSSSVITFHITTLKKEGD